MKTLLLIMTLTFVCGAVVNAAASDDGYMQNHPSYNNNYYNPSYNSGSSSPNYDSNYYGKTYNDSDSYRNSNDAPHGNDIRDYNPYYDRDGNLKR